MSLITKFKSLIAKSLSVFGVSTLTSSAAGEVPLTVKGASGQTANLSEWKDNSAIKVASIGSDGAFELGQYATAGKFGLKWTVDGNLGLSRSTGGTVIITLNTGANSISVGTVLGSSFKNTANTYGLEFATAHNLEQRGSTNPQTFNLYNTYTDTSNYERGFFKWSSNVLTIGTEALGTGANRNIEFVAGGATRATILSNGNIGIGNTSPSYALDIGAVGGLGKIRINSFGAGVAGIRMMEDAGGGDVYGHSFGYDAGTNDFRILRHNNSQAGNSMMNFNRSVNQISIGTTSYSAALAIQTYSAVDILNLIEAGGTTVVSFKESGNVGIGTTSPTSKLQVTNGDIEVETIASGLILKSPNGTRFRITVGNDGALTSTAI